MHKRSLCLFLVLLQLFFCLHASAAGLTISRPTPRPSLSPSPVATQAPTEVPDKDAPRVYLDTTSLDLVPGAYGWLNAHLMQGGGRSIRRAVWESSDTDIISIDGDGKYLTQARGSAQLIRRLTLSDDSEVVGICQVRVVIPVESLRLPQNRMILLVGSESPLPEVEIEPADADVRTVTWTSSQPSVLAVTEKGLKALSAGTVQLTARSDEQIPRRQTKSASLTVVVIPAVKKLVLTHAGETLRLEAGTRLALEIHITPQEAGQSALSFASSDPSVATVSETGTVIGIAPGKAEIRVFTDRTDSGKRLEEKLTVHVFRKIARLNLSPNPYVAFRGETISLTATVSPSDADTEHATLSWTSSNPFSASIAEAAGLSATLSANQVGQSTVTCIANDGSRKRASLHLRVEPTLPLALREGKRTVNQLLLKVKSRMRETAISGVTLAMTFLSGEGEVLLQSTGKFTGLSIPAARFADLTLALPKAPEGASLLRLQVTEITYAGGSYVFPENEENLEIRY